MKPQLKSLRLLKNNGQFGFILPNNILRTTVYDVVRKQLIQNWKIRKIIDLKSGVFKGVTASTIILIIEAINPSEEHNIEIINNTNEGTIKETSISKIKQNECIKNPSFVINIFSDKYTISIFEKMNKNSFNLGSLIKVLNGIATGKDKAGLLERKINQNSKPIIFGKDISRYYFKWSGKYVNYVRESLLRARDESIFLSSDLLH